MIRLELFDAKSVTNGSLIPREPASNAEKYILYWEVNALAEMPSFAFSAKFFTNPAITRDFGVMRKYFLIGIRVDCAFGCIIHTSI